MEQEARVSRSGIYHKGVSRRRLIQLGALGSLSLAMVPRTVLAKAGVERKLSFNALHTGETLKTVFWQDGAYVPEALKTINYLLRDFRTGDVKEIDPALLDTLFVLRHALDTKDPFEVISGYRSPATNAMLRAEGHGVAKHSFHMKGMAIDIRVENRRLRDLHRAALALKAGGVGYYPVSNFVHVDTGPVRHWG